VTTQTRPTLTVLLVALLAGFVLLPVPHTAFARAPEGQEATEGRISLARQAFAVGDLEEAARIYREVLKTDPENERAFWGLVRVYASDDKEESHLIPMLEERLRRHPDDSQAAMELGETYAKLGEHERAHEWWSTLLTDSRTDVNDYSNIGASEIRHRMYEQALETFMTGRAKFRSESLFSQELVTVHTALGDFGSAIDECVITVNHHGGAVQWATNRIELLMEEGAGRRLVLDKMDAIAESDDATVEELGLVGSVYLVLGHPERALESFLSADDRAGGRGEQLLEYAEILRDEGLPEQARAAYLMVVERHPGQSAAARAGISAATLLAASGDPANSVVELRAVADAFDGSNPGAQALFEAARVELASLEDPEAALATVSEMRSRFGQRARRFEEDAVLIEVDAYMMQGRFGDAHERASTLAHEGTRDEVRERAEFALGFASFLQHDHDSATEEFRGMIEANPGGELVNDALRLMLVIANAQEAGVMEPVNLLSDAHAARIAGDDILSEELLESLASARTGGAVEAEALLLLGAMATVEGDYDQAIERYDRVIGDIEALTPRAEAMMRKADILAFRGRDRDAIEQYLALLEELPDNILSGEARRKLDRLRRGEEG